MTAAGKDGFRKPNRPKRPSGKHMVGYIDRMMRSAPVTKKSRLKDRL